MTPTGVPWQTRAETVPNLDELRRLVAAMIPHLQWRHHGLGVLQGYVREGEKEETRIHVWHPDLQRDGMQDSGQLHNHRFDMRSTVLCGEIGHTEYSLTPDPEGHWQTFPVVHARKAMAATGTFDCLVEATPERFRADIKHWIFVPGDVYRFSKWSFHGTDLRGPCVTLVSKSQQEDQSARILAPHGSAPIHGFVDPLPDAEWTKYLHDAIVALEADE